MKAWFDACTGLTCNGIRVGFWNSVRILIPSVILSIAVGALTGYTLSFWRPRGAELLFGDADGRRVRAVSGVHLPAGAHLRPRRR